MSTENATVLAVVYGSRRFGVAALSGEHLYRAEVKCLRRTPNRELRFTAHLRSYLERFPVSKVCEVIETERVGAFEPRGRELLAELASSCALPITTVDRARLRARHVDPGRRPSNDEVGRRILREYPELAARYGPPEGLGQTKHPTPRERYLYLLFLAVAGAEEALHENILHS